MTQSDRRIAYFSMEAALDNAMPTFSGGLGVLAGDYLRSAADLGLPVVGISLLYRDGYFRQRLDGDGRQEEEPVIWQPPDLLHRLEGVEIAVEIEGRAVRAAVWRYDVVGETGAVVPVYFLDSDLSGNDEADRSITDELYGGDERHRLRQEALLGIGGIDLLRRIGCEPSVFHMNEGHSSLLTVRLIELEMEKEGTSEPQDALERVREACTFTTHTPVPAGHDRFNAGLVKEVLGADRTSLIEQLGLLANGELNMTELGTRCSRYVNAVSRRHRAVAQAMLPGVVVSSVTNGVRVVTWASPSVRAMFDRHLEGWRRDSAMLRYATTIDLKEVEEAHASSKRALLAYVADRNGARLDPKALTLGLARRVTAYKQTTLLFSDLDRLRRMVDAAGPLQVVCAGKAHPRDEAGKRLIEDLFAAARNLEGDVAVVFLENYDLAVARLLCAGSDVWLNNPVKPQEASGTSGMKAAVNGVPSLSVLDGWWVEGWIEGVTGWAIGTPESTSDSADDLYAKLESAVLPCFYETGGLAEVRRHAIALNGSYFSTDRMAREYAEMAYLL